MLFWKHVYHQRRGSYYLCPLWHYDSEDGRNDRAAVPRRHAYDHCRQSGKYVYAYGKSAEFVSVQCFRNDSFSVFKADAAPYGGRGASAVPVRLLWGGKGENLRRHNRADEEAGDFRDGLLPPFVFYLPSDSGRRSAGSRPSPGCHSGRYV